MKVPVTRKMLSLMQAQPCTLQLRFSGACGERGGKGDGWQVPELPWGGHLFMSQLGQPRALLCSPCCPIPLLEGAAFRGTP